MTRNRFFSVCILILALVFICTACSVSGSPKKDPSTTVVYEIPNRYVSTPYRYYEYWRDSGIKKQSDIVLAPNPQERKPAGSYYPLVKSEGFTFVGWSLDGKNVYDPTVTIEMKEFVHFYALYTVNVYTVSYELNGGSNDDKNPTSYTVEDGNRDDRIPLYDPERKGYSFLGWVDDYYSDWGGYQNYIDTRGNMLHDAVFSAEWEPYEYDVWYSFSVPSYTVVGGELPGTYTIEDEVILYPVEHDDDIFLGWYDNAEGNGEPIEKIERGTTGTLHFYAIFQPA